MRFLDHFQERDPFLVFYDLLGLNGIRALEFKINKPGP